MSLAISPLLAQKRDRHLLALTFPFSYSLRAVKHMLGALSIDLLPLCIVCDLKYTHTRSHRGLMNLSVGVGRVIILTSQPKRGQQICFHDISISTILLMKESWGNCLFLYFYFCSLIMFPFGCSSPYELWEIWFWYFGSVRKNSDTTCQGMWFE